MENTDFTDSRELSIPRGKKNEPPIYLDLGAVLSAESRQIEVAFVTPQKAPELLHAFNKAWSDLAKSKAMLSYEKGSAEKELNKRKAVLLLEVIPQKLKAMDIGSSADTRQAVIDLDEEYQECQERYDRLAAVVEYINGKMKSFENSFSSVKKIMHEDAYSFMPGEKGDRYTDSIEEKVVGQVSKASGFGKPRY